jgi:RNA polymerase II-associated protein 3
VNDIQNDTDVVEEVYTSMSATEIQDIIEECDQLKIRGNEAFGAGEYGQAILHYSLCIDKASELPDATDNHDTVKSLYPRDVVYSNRSAAFLKLGQHEKAENDATMALQINPNNIKANFRKGLALHASGKYQEALPILAYAYKMEPHNKQIKQAIQFCEVRLEQEFRQRMSQS